MFSGIVETQAPIESLIASNGSLRIQVRRPPNFDDVQVGQSIAVDGVCLTVESLSPQVMVFCLGPETLSITHWGTGNLAGKTVNLERSLRLADRIHGHFVSGHIDGLGDVVEIQDSGESRVLVIGVLGPFQRFLLKKGSVAVNGVSLTINEVGPKSFKVCLIPETLRQTNLCTLKRGDQVTLEVDPLVRAVVESAQVLLDARSTVGSP